MKNTSNFDFLTLPGHIAEELDNPNWKRGLRYHNWKDYVEFEFKEVWHLLSERERTIIAYMAEQRADREDYYGADY